MKRSKFLKILGISAVAAPTAVKAIAKADLTPKSTCPTDWGELPEHDSFGGELPEHDLFNHLECSTIDIVDCTFCEGDSIRFEYPLYRPGK